MSGDERLKVFRAREVTYKEGKPEKHFTFSFFAIGNVQPLIGKDLLLVPEGDRDKEQYEFFCLNCEPCEDTLQLSDRVVRGGVNFEVQSVEPWGSYCIARIMRIDVGPDVSN